MKLVNVNVNTNVNIKERLNIISDENTEQINEQTNK